MTSSAVNPPGQLLVIGGGYTGRRFASAARRALGFEALLTWRSACPDPASPDPAMHGARWLPFDAAQGAIPSPQDLEGTTHVLVTLPPDPSGQDPALTHLAPLLLQLPCAGRAHQKLKVCPGLQQSRAVIAPHSAGAEDENFQVGFHAFPVMCIPM